MGLAQYYSNDESVQGMTRKLTDEEIKLQKQWLKKNKVTKVISKYDNETKYDKKKYKVVVA